MDKIKLILNLLPLLIALIKSVEVAIPEKGQGAVKLAIIKDILIAADSTVSAIWPLIETTINALVKAFNVSGVFNG